jgi:3-phenylpropionate/trans-cinnamate dioxygenase ferredoxin reductase component
MNGGSSNISTVVIIGAGLAGAKAAESLRGWGFEGRVVLAGEESLRPYERPVLSKDYLGGTVGFDDAAVHDEGFYNAHHIDLVTSTRATAIDVAASRVTLEPGGSLAYDRLLLATGAEPRKLDVSGSDLEGVFSLRTVRDADAIRAAAPAGARAVVIGAGLLGSEVAASLRRTGAEVALVGRGSVPLERVLGPEVGRAWRDLHVERGVELHLGVEVSSLAGRGSVDEVRLSDGTSLGCDLVVAGISAIPRTELAEAAGLEMRNGVVTDDHLETSVPRIFAAGDVANAYHPVFHDHIGAGHWWAALTQGPVAAANMLGHRGTYDWMPYFSSKQFDLMMEYTGFAPHWDDVVVRGDVATRSFVAFYVKEGAVRAGMNANVPGVARHIRTLVESGATVEPALLADPGVDMAELAERVGRTGAPERSGLGAGLRQWYETCPCCLSQALPEVKQRFDEERTPPSRVR